MAPVPAPVLDCTESGLSVTANIMGILTFVAAIALALQLSLYEARQWLDQQQWARQYHDLQRRTRVQAILVSALLKKKDLPWYTKDMHLSDEYRKSNLERMNEDLGEWYTDFIALHGQVTNMLWFGFWINRPLVWLVKRRDRWLRAETDILKLRLDDVEKKFRKLDDEYPLSCQPVDHDLTDIGFKERVFRELAQLRGKMAKKELLHGIEVKNSSIGHASTEHRGRRNSV